MSEVIKKKDAKVEAHATAYLAAEGRFTVSAFSVMEIVYRLHRVGREDRITEFRLLIADHEILTFHSAMAATAGRIYADLERAGTPIGLTDVMIAAIALHHNLPLVTGNRSHFDRDRPSRSSVGAVGLARASVPLTTARRAAVGSVRRPMPLYLVRCPTLVASIVRADDEDHLTDILDEVASPSGAVWTEYDGPLWTNSLAMSPSPAGGSAGTVHGVQCSSRRRG